MKIITKFQLKVPMNKFGPAKTIYIKILNRVDNKFKSIYELIFLRKYRLICQRLPLYLSSSGGDSKSRGFFALAAAQSTIPLIVELMNSQKKTVDKETLVEDFFKAKNGSDADLLLLAQIFTHQGSDKASYHNYHYLYTALFPERMKDLKIFEIGLGTNNMDVISNMGRLGVPGASLRSFREFFPSSNIFGADIDKRVLFQENRIKTFFIDQLDQKSFSPIKKELAESIDLFVDDGFHSPDANINSLMLGLRLVKKGGWVVIEDIPTRSKPIWDLLFLIMKKDYEVHILKARHSYIFLVRKG
jgi:hypothetical protein